MNSTTRRAALGAAASLAAAVVVGTPTAQAAEAETYKSVISVRSSDYEVQPGERFALRGKMTSRHQPVDDARVRVQTYRSGGWENLSGAVVSTDSEGRYRVHVILSSGGDRDLRVVGNPPGDRIRISRAYAVVRVLG